MEPVPYEIREQDVDEVISAYGGGAGREWNDERRAAARDHVMRHVNELNDTVRSAAEEDRQDARAAADRAGEIGERPGARSPARRDAALQAIEDLLIRDGFLEAPDSRIY